jgi:hypothetical protein
MEEKYEGLTGIRTERVARRARDYRGASAQKGDVVSSLY